MKTKCAKQKMINFHDSWSSHLYTQSVHGYINLECRFQPWSNTSSIICSLTTVLHKDWPYIQVWRREEKEHLVYTACACTELSWNFVVTVFIQILVISQTLHVDVPVRALFKWVLSHGALCLLASGWVFWDEAQERTGCLHCACQQRNAVTHRFLVSKLLPLPTDIS